MPAIEIDDLAEKRHLFDTPRNELFHFADDCSNCTASLAATRPWDNAKRAMHIAPLHDGNKGRRKLRFQLVVPNRFSRPNFVPRVANRETRIIHSTGPFSFQ